MAGELEKGTLLKGKRVTAINPVLPKESGKATSVYVEVQNEVEKREYDHVISTIPLSCLRTVDMSKCNLTYKMKAAIRALRYDASVKIAIKFSKRWWEEPSLLSVPQIGGVSKTDRPTRVVVYPSYGIGEKDKGATMIVR